MGRLEERVRRLEKRRGLRKEKPQHGWGVPTEEIERQFLHLILKRMPELAEERGEPYQELRELRDEYARLDVEEQTVRRGEFEEKVARLAPKAYAALFEELGKAVARIYQQYCIA